jgi:hypothetical protein
MSEGKDIEREIAEEDELSELLRPSDRGLVIPPFSAVVRRAQRRQPTLGFALATLAALLVVAAVSVGMWQAATAPATAPTPQTTSPTSSPAPSRVPPDAANRDLAGRAQATGRSEIAICLYVDPAANLDPSSALTDLQSTVTALVRQGYTVLGERPVAQCTEAPHFLRTNSVHPKNSGNGVVAPVPRVSAPSPFYLVVAVTTPARMTSVFGALPSHRGSEEVSCTGDVCGSVTESIYAEPSVFANAGEREQLVLEGFGLLGGR